MTSALIDGIVYALVWLGAPIGKQCLIGFDEFAAAVGAATINDKPFIVAEVLSLDRCNRAGQSLAVVIIDSNDGKPYHNT